MGLGAHPLLSRPAVRHCRQRKSELLCGSGQRGADRGRPCFGAVRDADDRVG
jgi:hypothetical protein